MNKSMNDQKPQQHGETVGLSRRHFLKATSVAAAGATALNFPSVLAQTTQPIEKVRELVRLIRRRFPHADLRFIDTVCRPTKQRQHAAIELAQQADVVVAEKQDPVYFGVKASMEGATVQQLDNGHSMLGHTMEQQ